MAAADTCDASEPGDRLAGGPTSGPTSDLITRARTLWAHQAGLPLSAFSPNGLAPVIAPGSATAPPGLVGIVAIDGQTLTTVPDASTAAAVREHLGGLNLAQVRDETHWYGWVGAREHLGPAYLSYGTGADVISPGSAQQTQLIAADDPGLAELLDHTDPGEAGEAALRTVTSSVAVIQDPSGVVAAAGYQNWPAGDTGQRGAPGEEGGSAVAHLSVLVAAEVRGQHLAPVVAAAAAAEAGRRGLLLQWRARPPASRRVAARIGLHELGWQLSLDCRP